MGRGKGPEGITIKETISRIINEKKSMTPKEMVIEVKKIGPLTDNAIFRHIMGLMMNLPAAASCGVSDG